MSKKYKEAILISVFVILLIIAVSGATFSYLNATVRSGENDLAGQTYVFDVDVSLTTIRSGNLIPTSDNLIVSSVNSSNSNNRCLDARGYSLCSMYQLTLTNRGTAQTLNGYIETASATDYTTDHLKYRLYTLNNGTYTLVSDTLALSHTANAKNYFKLSNSNMSFSLADGSTTSQSRVYYLVIWLSDTGSNQLEDVNKHFAGSITFTSVSGNNAVSQFMET